MDGIKGENMDIKAVIVTNPCEALYGETEQIITYDITVCQDVLKQLKMLVDLVNNHPESVCDTAKAMAFMIEEICKGIKGGNK